jgi:hypothetical protein
MRVDWAGVIARLVVLGAKATVGSHEGGPLIEAVNGPFTSELGVSVLEE